MECTHRNNALDAQAETANRTTFSLSQPPLYLHRPLNVLLVEDNPSDTMLTQIAIEAIPIECEVSAVSDGEQALSYLNREGRYTDEPKPDAILLDLTMPELDGFEVLAQLRQYRALQSIPIIILTGAEHYSYIMKTYGLWIPAYITKPCNSDKLMKAFEMLEHRPKSCQPKPI